MICWFENHSNNVMCNIDYVFLMSTISSRHSGMYLQKENFRLGLALYVSRDRVIVKNNWVNDADQYFKPYLVGCTKREQS
jgi:hypothetical protein